MCLMAHTPSFLQKGSTMKSKARGEVQDYHCQTATARKWYLCLIQLSIPFYDQGAQIKSLLTTQNRKKRNVHQKLDKYAQEN